MPKNLFSKGNKKINSNCAIFSLPNKVTCKLGLKCRAYCYGNSSPYPRVTDLARARWYEASKQASFVDLAIAELKRMRALKYVRVHAFGDFYSYEYIQKWYEIARALPEVIFYAYTKRDDIITPEILKDRPSNLRMIFSIDGVDPDLSKVDEILAQGYDRVAVVFDKLSVKESCVTGGLEHGYCMKACKKCAASGSGPIFIRVHGVHKNKR